MVDYADSSQLNLWLFKTVDELSLCRKKANDSAKRYLVDRQKQLKREKEEAQQQKQQADSSGSEKKEGTAATTTPSAVGPPPVEQFACGFSRRLKTGEEEGENSVNDASASASDVPDSDLKGHPFLTPDEEEVLVSFYVSILPRLIGPAAKIPRLRRESKVAATAALLLRRFFLSNSVMVRCCCHRKCQRERRRSNHRCE
jgi:cyclin H